MQQRASTTTGETKKMRVISKDEVITCLLLTFLEFSYKLAKGGENETSLSKAS